MIASVHSEKTRLKNLNIMIIIIIMGAVAHGKRLSQKIQQLLNNKVETIFFIPTCTELNSLSIYVVCGLWLHVMQVDVYKLDFVRA